MTDAPPRRIGLPWYSREDYPRIRAMMTDRHNLASTYEAWLASAENNETVGQQARLLIARIMIEPDAFASWCEEQGLEPDGKARTTYAAEMSARITA